MFSGHDDVVCQFCPLRAEINYMFQVRKSIMRLFMARQASLYGGQIGAARTRSGSIGIQWSEDEGQDAFHAGRSAIEGRRFEDPLTSGLYGRAAQREVATGGSSFDNKPFFRDGNLHLDCSFGVQLFGVRRVDRFDSGYRATLYYSFRNLPGFGNQLRLLRQ